VTKYFINNIKSFSSLPCSVSDHDYIEIKITIPETPSFGPGYWKFNNSLLSDTTFCNSFELFWKKLISGKIITTTWWDEKIELQNFIKKYSKNKAQNKRATILQLQKQYRDLITASKLNPQAYADQISACKEHLSKIHSDLHNGAVIRSKAIYLDNQEKPSRYFFRKESNHGQNKHITKINENNDIVANSADILSAFRQYYQKLYSKERVDTSLFPEFLSILPTISSEQKDTCEGLITKEECLKALKDMRNDKSPGSDGLTKEFYLHFFYLIGETYVKVINNCFELHQLSYSQRLGYITLLCKDREHSDLLKNWRPISLLNLDYKIISKVLTIRLRNVMSDLVYIDQTCSVPGRSILDNTHLLRSVIDYVNQKNIFCGILSLDQEKAFDRVDHTFLFACLKQYGFGNSFLQWV